VRLRQRSVYDDDVLLILDGWDGDVDGDDGACCERMRKEWSLEQLLPIGAVSCIAFLLFLLALLLLISDRPERYSSVGVKLRYEIYRASWGFMQQAAESRGWRTLCASGGWKSGGSGALAAAVVESPGAVVFGPDDALGCRGETGLDTVGV